VRSLIRNRFLVTVRRYSIRRRIADRIGLVAVDRRGRCRLSIRKRVKPADQIRIVALRLRLGFCENAEQFLDRVDRLQNECNRIRRYREFSVAKLAQNVFGGVRNLFQPGQSKETARTLESVNQAENAAQQLRIVGFLFESDDLHIETIDCLVRLGQKFAKKVVHDKPR